MSSMKVAKLKWVPIIALVLMSHFSTTSAIFHNPYSLGWMKYFHKGMHPKPAAYSAAAAPAAAASTPTDQPFVDIRLANNQSGPIDMFMGRPAAFPILVTNNGDQDLTLTFQVIETPGPEGDSTGALQVLGIRPFDGVPSKTNPLQLEVPAKSTVKAEVALLTPRGALTDVDGLQTAATITATDPEGRTQYLKEPLVINIFGSDNQQIDTLSTCKDISQVLNANGETSTFAAIWDKGGLSNQLSSASGYSVLAPTDQAFEMLLDTLGISKEKLLESPSLDTLGLHHVLVEALTPDQIASKRQVKTASCNELDVAIRNSMITVGNCSISASEANICNGELYTMNCVLPPPPAGGRGNNICLPPASPSPPQSAMDGQEDIYDDYTNYDYDFEYPPSFPQSSSSPQVAAAPGGSNLPRTPMGSPQGVNDMQQFSPNAQYEMLETIVLPKRVPDKWTRLNHLANAGDKPVKATFLPPGWKEWITPGESICRSGSNQCSMVKIHGRSCDERGMIHTCGYLESEGPKSYQIQPPPQSFQDGFITIGDTYIWQSVEGGSSYCTPATQDGSSFKGSVYHEAWVEPTANSKDLDVMLFLLQNPLNGSPWQVVSMQTSPVPGTADIKRIKTIGQGCFLWVVASSSGEGSYDFHLSVRESP